MKINRKLVVIVAVAAFAGILVGRGCSGSDPVQSEHAHSESESGQPEVKFWTCSMHPQIKQPGPGKCPLCAMDLIPVTDGGDDEPTGLRELKLSETAIALAAVETTPVERRFATARIRMVGKVDYDEARLAYLTAWVPGRLDRLYVDYTGIEVSKGDHMVSIYSPELLSAQEELLQSIETVESIKGSDLSLIKDRTKATLESSREKLRLWGLTDDQINNLEKSGKVNDHLTIYAPVSGTVIHKDAFEGTYVKTGTRIYTIADLSQVWIKMDAYESDIAWLHYGQDVTFETESYPGKIYRGTVAFIDPVLNEKTRTVKIRVNANNDMRDLKPGMFVRATVESNIAAGGRVMHLAMAGKMICPMHPEIIKNEPGECDICGMPLVSTEKYGYLPADADSQEAPLVIPVTAPLITGKRAIVYVKSADEKGLFEGREIVLGSRAGDYYIVERGLEEGEQVVTKGNFKLDAELQIYAKPSMMTPDGGGGGGGHDHGGPKPASGEEESAGNMSDSMLSSLTKGQLHEVLKAAMSVEVAVEEENMEEIRSAFSVLSQKVNDVSVDDISGHAALLWGEYAMLIGNDGLVGSGVNSLNEAKGVVDLLQEHKDSMMKKMGLAHMLHGSEPKPAINPEFLAQFKGVISGYLAMQDALAADNFEGAMTATQKAVKALDEVNMGLVVGDDHTAWMGKADKLKRALSEVAKSDNIEAARIAFSPLSLEVMATAQRFGAPEGPLYQFKCPMAFSGTGATWIQDDKKTRNPYYGESMLGCGSVIDALAGEAKKEGHQHD